MVRPFHAVSAGRDGQTDSHRPRSGQRNRFSWLRGIGLPRLSGVHLGDQGGSDPEMEEVGWALLACLRLQRSLQGPPHAASRTWWPLGAWAPQCQPGPTCQGL